MSPISTLEHRSARRSRGSAWRPLALAFGAVLGALGILWMYRFFIRTVDGQTLDAVGLAQAKSMGGGRLDTVTTAILDNLPAASIILAAIIVGLVAFVGKRWTPALWAVITAVAANLATQLLKYTVFTRPDLGVETPGNNSFPSGHTTLAASAAAAVTLAVPPRWRPLTAALGGTFAFVSGASTVVNLWHRPSDVAAALLVVGTVSALTAIPVLIHESRHPEPAGGGAAKVLSNRRFWSTVTLAIAALSVVAAFVFPQLPLGSLSMTGSDGVDTRGFWSGVAASSAVAYTVSWAGLLLLSRPRR
ncbi:phosphatase PAP2 family protein [Arthrobacter woluwensis]|uniref:phosphatase PAP2 family protein n=1 Tax=Arthrobacter woluwensis TaxID=156980 RepID=UPI003804B731